MHIGIDCRLPYYQMGGISRYTLQLLPALAALDAGNRYTVFQSRKDANNHVPQAANFRRASLWTPCHHRLERWALATELAGRRLDVFHSPDFIPPARGARRRVITVHDLNFLHYPQYLTEESLRYYAGQIRWAVAQADAIAADSEATRRDLLEMIGAAPEKVSAVPLAAAPIFAGPVSAAQLEEVQGKYRLPDDFILFVGTLEPRKNVPLLLEAMTRLPAALELPLALVGSKGWLYDDIFAAVQAAGLEERVFHLTGVPDGELAALYRTASLLALPSYHEGFGFPALEAMHGGCPVLVSNRGSLPEIVGEAGITLDPEEPDAWAAAIELVLSDSRQREQMVAAGYVQAGRFTWERTARMTLALYEGTQVAEG